MFNKVCFFSDDFSGGCEYNYVTEIYSKNSAMADYGYGLTLSECSDFCNYVSNKKCY